MEDAVRDRRGRFKKNRCNLKIRTDPDDQNIEIEHNYASGHICNSDSDPCQSPDCPYYDYGLGKNVSKEGWKKGRRIIEFDILLSNLLTCRYCTLGPIPLTYHNIVGELQQGLGGYLYVVCQNAQCMKVNCVAYGATYYEKKASGIGKRSFAINTKLGTAMIDGAGGPDRVNNFLSTLNMKPIGFKNMKKMERRAGAHVEAVANRSMKKAIDSAVTKEMRDIHMQESRQAAQDMEMIDRELGIGLLPGATPVKDLLVPCSMFECSDEEGETTSTVHNKSFSEQQATAVGKVRPSKKKLHSQQKGQKVNLVDRFPCKSRTGISCAVDTAWSKRGFDSLTSHTFFMSKAKYGKKVLKTVVLHRTCATCKWWKKNRPFQKIRNHRCILNHIGSARMMESASGIQGIKELEKSGVHIEYIEGDGDNTLLARTKKELNISLKKRFDRNHVVKNVGKSLFNLHNKNKKLSKTVIMHIQKCLKYAFAKNQGDKEGLEENLRAIVPHQFDDHSFCSPRFCAAKRNSADKYIHKSLPFKAPLKGEDLRLQLESVFKTVIQNAEKYSDLGSSQQCEHANREVTLRAPKSHHYGNSEALDMRVAATSAFINEGRSYIMQVNEEAGLSPGNFTSRYATKQTKRRVRVQERAALPSVKRRRLILKQERAITQAACETLEGQSYQSGVGLEEEPDVEEVPAAVPHGNFKPVTLKPDQHATVIMFDLETTDLIRGHIFPHITQIAAVEPHSNKKFNRYVIPKVPIAEAAQQVTGIVCSDSGDMNVHGEPVSACKIGEALEKFWTYLDQFSFPVLVAHNGRKFDFPVFISSVKSARALQKMFANITGFIDSLTVFKKVFPGQECYKQEHLVRTLLCSSYSAHDAQEDVESLGSLILHTGLDSKTLLQYSYSPTAVYNSMLFNEEKHHNLNSLCPLISNGVMKRATAENVAGSGLNFNHLQKIFNRDGEDGLKNVFISKNSEGQPRVTNTKRVLEEVIPKLAEYFQK